MAPFMKSTTNLSSSLLAQDMQVRFSFIVSLKQNFQISSRKNKVLVGTLKVYMMRREIQKMINNIIVIVLFLNKLEYKREKRIVFKVESLVFGLVL